MTTAGIVVQLYMGIFANVEEDTTHTNSLAAKLVDLAPRGTRPNKMSDKNLEKHNSMQFFYRLKRLEMKLLSDMYRSASAMRPQ